MRLLLLSNSKNAGEGYLDHAKPIFNGFLGTAVKTVLFIPYAGVTVSFDEYTRKVGSIFRSIGYELESIHKADDPVKAVESAEALAVGGGNTFQLLKTVQENKLIEPIRKRVADGMKYMGWSAGSNLTCPTIKTTNDMPIVLPASFDALNLIPFQINPHYTDENPPGHQGETRDDRIAEFIEINPEMIVAGLREGSIFLIEGTAIKLIGEKALRVFKHGTPPQELSPDQPLNFLMQKPG